MTEDAANDERTSLSVSSQFDGEWLRTNSERLAELRRQMASQAQVARVVSFLRGSGGSESADSVCEFFRLVSPEAFDEVGVSREELRDHLEREGRSMSQG